MNSPLKRPIGSCNWVLLESLRVYSQIIWFQFLRKSIFCVFGGPKKLFGTPKTPQKPYTSKTFWSQLSFMSYKWQNRYFLAQSAMEISQTVAQIKRMTPPQKNWGQIRSLGFQKVFCVPQNAEKLIFAKKTWILWFVWTLGLVFTVALVTQLPSDLFRQFIYLT